MSEAKHTPGPWSVTSKFEVGPRSLEDDQSNGMVVPVADVFGPNREADARLIAAAPELLEALKGALEWMSSVEGHLQDAQPFKRDKATFEAAVAKAEGRSVATGDGRE